MITLTLMLAQTFLGTALPVLAQADGQGKPPQDVTASLAQYIDLVGGMTADEAVAYASSHNPELQAARTEVEASRALVKQARLRPNPMLDVSGIEAGEWAR